MNKIKHYSYSLFSAYKQCSKKVFFGKLWGIEQMEKDFYIYGSKIHKQVDNYHKGLKYDEKLIKRYTDKIPKDFYKETEMWLPQTKLYNPLNENDIIETPFVGRIDGIVAKNDAIADLKTYNGSMSQKMADESEQATLYLFMQWVNNGGIPPSFIFINFRKDKNKKGEPMPIQIIETKRKKRDFIELWKELKNFDNSIKDEIFYKEPGYQCRYCEYKRICSAE
jgi:CRISPR/Cas system-associated exonuclease Cas4 (RecB family)